MIQRTNIPNPAEGCEQMQNKTDAVEQIDTNGTQPRSPDVLEWQPISTYKPEYGEVLVWCDEGMDISKFSEMEPDGVDSMGHDAGWWGIHQPMDPGRSMGNPAYTRDPENQPWAWMPKPEPPPYDDEGEPLFPRLEEGRR